MHLTPVHTDIVLLGAGLAHLEVLRRFAMRAEPGVRLTLVGPEPETPWPGMLPGLIRAEYSIEQTRIDLAPLAARAGARLIVEEPIGIDPDRREVSIAGRPPLPYDVLSIDVGGEPAIPDNSDGLPVKPSSRFLERLVALGTQLPPGARIAVIGGGAAGTELALALRFGLGERARVTLVSETTEPVAQAPPRIRQMVRRALVDAGVELVSGVSVTGLAAGRLSLSDGSTIEVAEALWATGLAGPGVLARSGLDRDTAGCVVVDATLRSRSHPGVFAAGDCAVLDGRALPGAGVRAVRAGQVLAENLRRTTSGRPLRHWRPQPEALAIMGLGQGRAVAWRNGLSVYGRLVWRWKDRIDRRWINRYQQPARVMVADEPVSDGGGAKLGAEVLAGALAALPHRSGDDVLVGLDAADDAAVLLPPPDQAVVQSVDSLRAFIDDPFLFGQIAAAHALSDLYAMGARPWSALAVATVRSASGPRMRAELSAMLLGASEVLRAEGCTLVGGHSSAGSEPALGFAVTGLADPKRLLRKSGLQPGDALVLTKPLGTGIVMAGQRRGRAQAAWLLAALDSMRATNAVAVDILRTQGVTACTDVGGFGLAGHLMEMLRASGVAAVLLPEAVPALPGALELAARGVETMLAVENRRQLVRPPADPCVALLVDPQTSGGLLAGIPADHAEVCLAALRARGLQAAIIGAVEPTGNRPPIRFAES